MILTPVQAANVLPSPDKDTADTIERSRGGFAGRQKARGKDQDEGQACGHAQDLGPLLMPCFRSEPSGEKDRGQQKEKSGQKPALSASDPVKDQNLNARPRSAIALAP
jgi:hypothetical protein